MDKLQISWDEFNQYYKSKGIEAVNYEIKDNDSEDFSMKAVKCAQILDRLILSHKVNGSFPFVIFFRLCMFIVQWALEEPPMS